MSIKPVPPISNINKPKDYLSDRKQKALFYTLNRKVKRSFAKNDDSKELNKYV